MDYSLPRRIALGIFVLTALVALPASAAHRPKVCLVLSGGGARGAAHVGVLEILEKLDVPVDCIVGTSFGAIIGGLYASGMSPKFLEHVLKNPRVQREMADNRPRSELPYRVKQRRARYLVSVEFGYKNGTFHFPEGLVRGHSARELLNSLTLWTRPSNDFGKLPIPFRAVATDIETGKAVVLDHGNLAQVMRASMAVPGFYSPVRLQGHLLADGGLVRNLPVGVAEKMGADIIIAVDVSTPLANAESLNSVLGVSVQVVNLLTRENVKTSIAKLDSDDVVIRPKLDGVDSRDFDKMGEAIYAGRQAALAAAPALKQWAVTRAEYQKYLDRQRHMVPLPNEIALVRIKGNNHVPAALIRSQIRSQVGQPFKLHVLKQDVRRLYALGQFERVDTRVVHRNGREGIVFSVQEKPWTPNYAELGLHLVDDFEGDSFYDLRFGFRKPAVNRLGGEWDSELQVGRTRRVYTALYQPIGYGSPYFIEPSFEYRNHAFYKFSDITRTAEYNTRTIGVAVAAGRELGNVGQVRVGFKAGNVDVTPHVGDADLAEAHADFVGYTFSLGLSTLDNYNFPSSGFYVNFSGFLPRYGLGGDLNYDKVRLTAGKAFQFGDNNFLVNTTMGTSFGTRIPFYNQFTLGGFLSLSGLRQNELRGNQVFAARLIYYNRVSHLPGVLGGGIYIGGSLEAGNVWQDQGHNYFSGLRYGASVFVGADTAIGALYLGAGLSQSNQAALYLYLGRPF
jgi:NTE family protein